MNNQSISIKTFTSTDLTKWNQYVKAHRLGTFFHLSQWQALIENCFQHPTYYLYAEQDGKIVGLLPLVHMKSLFFGNTLISTPFCVKGGILADSNAIQQCLQARAIAIGESLAVDCVEIRNTKPVNEHWIQKKLYVNFAKGISQDSEKNLLAIPRKQRAVVRKGIKAKLTITLDDNIDRFYRAYSESVRNLGTPVLPKYYFQAIKDSFTDDCDILTISYQGQLLSSVMSFYYNQQVMPYYGGGGQIARHYKANDFMYWSVMNHAIERGCSIFDYGRSKIGTGAYRFKKNWGFEPEPLAYEYYLITANEIPDVNPLNPKYQLFIKAWQKLPLSLSQKIGPLFAKQLG